MNHPSLQYLAIPSATVQNAWVGVVTDVRTGLVMTQTIIAYRHPDQARFGARRKWAEWVRAQQLLTGEVA